ncbi:MbcA/ParS/Xre antitoxin family protein [Calidithermus roseus]|uniref:Antitoxin Xre/MbcA/ParS-like toxin-binding domain-containing protein n=1 Tax=Calidithermus roseus TaxID=1644118 RepID=A0A399ER94_9DEIN|nr:MbcA/ParS/Xre antitoxin family protein [Calidithermus roseus]RIH85559.1 hypothetical protein Mrose_02123 [Calidithermus roseus]
MIYLLRRAEELFGSPHLAVSWMNSPKVFLQGASPLSYLDTEPGFQLCGDSGFGCRNQGVQGGLAYLLACQEVG